MNVPCLAEKGPSQIIILRPKVIHYKLHHIRREHTFRLLHLMRRDNVPLAGVLAGPSAGPGGRTAQGRDRVEEEVEHDAEVGRVERWLDGKGAREGREKGEEEGDR